MIWTLNLEEFNHVNIKCAFEITCQFSASKIVKMLELFWENFTSVCILDGYKLVMIS